MICLHCQLRIHKFEKSYHQSKLKQISKVFFRPRRFKAAEREGFEPSVTRKSHNGFRDRPIQPLWHLSNYACAIITCFRHCEIFFEEETSQIYTLMQSRVMDSI